MHIMTNVICNTICVCLPKYFSSLFLICQRFYVSVQMYKKILKVNNVITNLDKNLFINSLLTP